MQKANEEFVKTYDDSKYPKPSVTADIVIFGMFDKEEDNYRKIAEKELKVLLIQRGAAPYEGSVKVSGNKLSVQAKAENGKVFKNDVADKGFTAEYTEQRALGTCTVIYNTTVKKDENVSLYGYNPSSNGGITVSVGGTWEP